MLILGICGQPSSGKDTVANYLRDKGFRHISTGDILREEMRLKNLPIDRVSMHDYVATRRKEMGADYLAVEAAKRIVRDSAVSGFRNTEEVRYLQKKLGQDFVLIAVNAPIEKRYEWVCKRGELGDNVPFEKFKAREESERKTNPETFNVDNVIALADYSVSNAGSKEELFRQVDELVKKIK